MCSPLCHSATSLTRQMSWTAPFSSLCSVLHLLHVLVDVALQPAADLTQQFVLLPTVVQHTGAGIQYQPDQHAGNETEGGMGCVSEC